MKLNKPTIILLTLLLNSLIITQLNDIKANNTSDSDSQNPILFLHGAFLSDVWSDMENKFKGDGWADSLLFSPPFSVVGDTTVTAMISNAEQIQNWVDQI